MESKGYPKKRVGREEVTEAETSVSTKLIVINHKNNNSVNDSIVLMTTKNFSIDYSVRGTTKCKRCKGLECSYDADVFSHERND